VKNTFVALAIMVLSFAAAANENSDILQKAESGNLKALKSAFLLYSKTDGGDAEDVDIAIGKSIRRNPKNFLKALKQERAKVPALGSTLGNLGPDFADDFKKQSTELVKRLAAIQSVKDKALRAVRSECETELKLRIEKRSGE
jgi:hypothetical protein